MTRLIARIDPSQYNVIYLVPRDSQIKSKETVKRMQRKFALLHRIWDAYCVPNNQQCHKYEPIYHAVPIWGTSQQLHIKLLDTLTQAVHDNEEAFAVAGPDGATSNVQKLSEYLLSFEHNSSIFVFDKWSLQWAYGTYDLGLHLVGQEAPDDVA